MVYHVVSLMFCSDKLFPVDVESYISCVPAELESYNTFQLIWNHYLMYSKWCGWCIPVDVESHHLIYSTDFGIKLFWCIPMDRESHYLMCSSGCGIILLGYLMCSSGCGITSCDVFHLMWNHMFWCFPVHAILGNCYGEFLVLAVFRNKGLHKC